MARSHLQNDQRAYPKGTSQMVSQWGNEKTTAWQRKVMAELKELGYATEFDPCNRIRNLKSGIRNPKSSKIWMLESGIHQCGIRNPKISEMKKQAPGRAKRNWVVRHWALKPKTAASGGTESRAPLHYLWPNGEGSLQPYVSPGTSGQISSKPPW